MSCGEKEIHDDGPFGGVGVPDSGRTGRVRVDEPEDQSPELLEAADVGRRRRGAGQEGGLHPRLFLGHNAGERDQKDQIGLR